MNESEAENLIERGLSAGRPREAFTAQLLADSTAALVRSTRRRSAWRRAELAFAAVLIVGVAFLGGRLSAPPAPAGQTVGTSSGGAERYEIRVPREMLAWLEAARLFRQLGMEDRMARAVECAARLLPADTFIGDAQTPQAVAVARSVENQTGPVEPMDAAGPHPLAESMNRILAQVSGD